MRRFIGFATLAILLVLYVTTLQTIPNGSEHYYMIDVGETQNVLNQWGTLHATGYPLYVMVSNVLVAGLRLVGMDAATAPGVTSLIYGMVAMGLLYVLVLAVMEDLPLPHPSLVNRGERKTEGGTQSGRAKAGGSQTLPYERLLSCALAAGTVVVYGLTRTVWVHSSIAEVYSFGLMILVGLFLIALWPRPIRGRVYWLALLGGIGAFHHRAIAMAAPALVYAVWGEIFGFTPASSLLSARGRTSPPAALSVDREWEPKAANRYWVVGRRIGISLILGLLGFVQYAYLPLRAQAGAKWVYGEPGTWNGFWDQFLGREASRFIGTVSGESGLVANLNLVNGVLVTDLTVVGIVLGLAGLVVALWSPARRKVAITMLLSGGVAYGFHVLVYTDILSALILPVTLALAFGWLLLAEWVWNAVTYKIFTTDKPQPAFPIAMEKAGGKAPVGRGNWRIGDSGMLVGLVVVVIGAAGYLVGQNQLFIQEMTRNRTGLETIELAKGTPKGAVLMLDWGPRYYAAAFAQDLLGELQDIRLVTHKADFKQIVDVDKRELVTADFTFYNRPIDWWEAQLGRKVFLRAAAPHLVEIGTTATVALVPEGGGVAATNAQVVCEPNQIVLDVDWVAGSVPDHDLSVFVHLLDGDGAMIGQADEAAPVYGWRPLTSWGAGEVVHDVYALPRAAGAAQITYGLYRQLASGEFQNEYTFNAAVKCEP